VVVRFAETGPDSSWVLSGQHTEVLCRRYTRFPIKSLALPRLTWSDRSTYLVIGAT